MENAAKNNLDTCIWPVAPEDRHCRFCLYHRCGKYAPPEPKDATPNALEYMDAMERIVGPEVRTGSRKREIAWARFFVFFQLFRDGFRHEEIARALGKNRATVIHGINSVREINRHPEFYEQEIKIWSEFKEMLNSQKI